MLNFSNTKCKLCDEVILMIQIQIYFTFIIGDKAEIEIVFRISYRFRKF